MAATQQAESRHDTVRPYRTGAKQSGPCGSDEVPSMRPRAPSLLYSNHKDPPGAATFMPSLYRQVYMMLAPLLPA